MKIKYEIFIKLSCFIFSIISIDHTQAQLCGGSWELQRPLTIQCVSGQWIGWQNSGNPLSCPINPVYSGVQTNTFTFSNPVSGFSIDMKGFDGAINCPRIEMKINGIFYPLLPSNLSNFPTGSACTTGSFTYLTTTSDGYITVSVFGGNSFSGHGRITISNVIANSVSLSSNDVNGTVFSDPSNCMTIVPLELESFSGRDGGDCKALLSWKTGTELNVKSIEIQRSENGLLFSKAGVINPRGINSQYSFETDNSTDAYFRLKFYDLDGSFKYSDILFLNSSCEKDVYTLFPNPSFGLVRVTGLNSGDGLILTDISGRIIKRFSLQNGNEINIGDIAPGIYFAQLVNKGILKVTLKVNKQ